MEYPMRRARQALTEEECRAVLCRGTSGVLAVVGEDGAPYAVPLSYVWREDTLWFHCATEGRKLTALQGEPRVSFCVVDQDTPDAARFTTLYRSVLVFGSARVVTEPQEKRRALEYLCQRFAPGDTEGAAREIANGLPRVCVLAVRPEQITGKEAGALRARGTTPRPDGAAE